MQIYEKKLSHHIFFQFFTLDRLAIPSLFLR